MAVKSTPKGFRDYLPADSLKREFVVNKIISVFQKFGFDPLETPTLEFAETLKGKYGAEEKLIYEFKTRGGDNVALKYDQTVPLARVIAQYPKLPKPFKRYQIQPAYRGENPQKGRYREFLQCDADIVGVSTPLADAEILSLVYETYKKLDLEIIIKVNDRSLLTDVEPKYLATIDKLLKVGEIGVTQELQTKGLSTEEAKNTLTKVKNLLPTTNLDETISLFKEMGYPQDIVVFDPTLVRGLDYYTGLILEVVLRSNPISSSLAGGGRWDEMMGKFFGVRQPAVGFAVGVDRTIEAMEESGVLNTSPTNTKILLTIFSPELVDKSLEVATYLRLNNINTELWLDPTAKLEKQLKYADQKKIPFVVIIGPDEARTNKITLKNLQTKKQQSLSLDELPSKLSS